MAAKTATWTESAVAHRRERDRHAQHSAAWFAAEFRAQHAEEKAAGRRGTAAAAEARVWDKLAASELDAALQARQ